MFGIDNINMLMVGPPGAGKSMLAARLPTILPPLTPAELLEVSMIASVAGEIEGGALTNRCPFRAPHHSASMPALVGGGLRARPGEVSLAHHGVIFLEELHARRRGTPRGVSARSSTAAPSRRLLCSRIVLARRRFSATILGKQGQHGSARRDSGV